MTLLPETWSEVDERGRPEGGRRSDEGVLGEAASTCGEARTATK